MLTASRLLLGLILVCLFSLPSSAQEPTDEQIDQAIARALKFLSESQEKNHSWKVDSFGESTAATSLAVMSFMAAGQMPGEGPYGQQITEGIEWVLDHQKNGMLVHQKSHGPFYSHGISTLMLAEAVGMLHQNSEQAEQNLADPQDTSEQLEKRCRDGLEKAVKLILKAQAVPKFSKHRGGWRYQPTSLDSDLSVTGWQLLALRAARNAGCNVPAERIDEAVTYVKRCATFDKPGFTYQPGSEPTPTRSGTGILALEVCGQHHDPLSLAAADQILKRPLDRRDQYFYYGVYYCTIGMFQMGDHYWEETRKQIYPQLIQSQNADGSWLATNGSERSSGKVYCTAMAVLALTVEYRYLPIYQR